MTGKRAPKGKAKETARRGQEGKSRRCVSSEKRCRRTKKRSEKSISTQRYLRGQRVSGIVGRGAGWMGLRVPEHYPCRNYDSHPSIVSSFSTSHQLNCQMRGLAKHQCKREGEAWEECISTAGKDGCEEFRQRKSRARQSCSSRHTSRESTTQWRLRSIKTMIFFFFVNISL